MPKSKSATVVSKSKAAKKAAGSDRPVIYAEPEVFLLAGPTAITIERAKEMLGWEEETAEAQFGADYLLTDMLGTKIRCSNNVKNRPLYPDNYRGLRQEHLMKRWRLNGETIILDETGMILNGQHQLVALVLAEQARTSELEADHWRTIHGDTPITMDKVVVVGIAYDDAVINTMDTCKPRSLADVLYRSEYFSSMKNSDRRQISRMADWSIKLLWSRTGAGLDAYSPKRTHAEALDFINRHPKLLDGLNHIFGENKDGGITDKLRISGGLASGLIYLMGCAGEDTDVDGYRASTSPSEQFLDWKLWDKACDFWIELAKKAPSMLAVRKALGSLSNGGTPGERLAILAKAWSCFAEGDKITDAALELEYEVDAESGNKLLTECPVFGGIDSGNPKDSEALDPTAPTEEEIEARTAEINQRRGRPVVPAATTETKPARPRPAPRPAPRKG